MGLFEEYIASGADLSALGFSRCDPEPGYFCDPIGARVIGAVGVDGIHFCTVPGAGEYVFAVLPMDGTPGEGGYVRAVARSFSDFLGLLLSCRDTEAICRACALDRDQFLSYVSGIEQTGEVSAALDAVRALGVEPVADAYGYLRAVREEIDCEKLEYGEEYRELVSVAVRLRWNVGFDGAFFSEDGEDAEPIIKDVRFVWGGENFTIAGIYRFGRGFVADIARQVDPEAVCRVMQAPDGDSDDGENGRGPFAFSFTARLRVGGGTAKCTRMSAEIWTGLPESIGSVGYEICRRYMLDTSYAYQIFRLSFPYTRGDEAPVSLDMETRPSRVRVAVMDDPREGDEVKFRHPVGGDEYTLTVTSAEAFVKHIPGGEYVLPDRFASITYTVAPEFRDELTVTDADPGDQPKRRRGASSGEFYDVTDAIGIIGGADGPTSYFILSPGGERRAVSNPRFRDRPVRWRVDVYVREREGINVQL